MMGMISNSDFIKNLTDDEWAAIANIKGNPNTATKKMLLRAVSYLEATTFLEPTDDLMAALLDTMVAEGIMTPERRQEFEDSF